MQDGVKQGAPATAIAETSAATHSSSCLVLYLKLQLWRGASRLQTRQQLAQVLHQDSIGFAVVVILVHMAGCPRCIGLLNVVLLGLALLHPALLELVLWGEDLPHMALLARALPQGRSRLRGVSCVLCELLRLLVLPGNATARHLMSLYDNK